MALGSLKCLRTSLWSKSPKHVENGLLYPCWAVLRRAQGTTVNTEPLVEEGVSVMCLDRKPELVLATYTL